MKWFKKLSTVILIILAHYFDFALGRRACCTHFCITDDLEKSNEMITFESSMTVKMLLPFQCSLLMHIFFWVLTMLLIKQKITTTLHGWLIMLRKTMVFRPSSKILQLNSTEKVLFLFQSLSSRHTVFVRLHLSSSHPFWKESGMQKAVVAKQVQKEPHCMDSR